MRKLRAYVRVLRQLRWKHGFYLIRKPRLGLYVTQYRTYSLIGVRLETGSKVFWTLSLELFWHSISLVLARGAWLPSRYRYKEVLDSCS